MAIDVMSPRISFSHDLNQAEFVPIQQHRSDPSLPESASDFDFCLTYTSVLQDLSTADELFSGGRILPFELNKTPKFPNPPQAPPPSPPPAAAPAVDPKPITNSKARKRLKEFLSVEESDDERPRLTRSSFWQFGRSASLNCENSRCRSLIRPLQFLSRSYSTGSEREPVPCSKQTAGRKDQLNKRQLRKQNSTAPTSSNSCPRSHSHHHHRQKPPLNKNYRSYGVEGAGARRVSLVLNLPPQYISKATVGLVGLGSLLCNGKPKKKKK